MEYVAAERGIEPVLLPALQREISPLGDAAAVRGCVQLIRERRPHILHTHTAKAGAVGRIAARALRPRPSEGRRAHVPRPRAARLLRPPDDAASSGGSSGGSRGTPTR